MENTDDFIIKNGTLKKYRGTSSSVVIPNGVTKIDKDAFWGCDSIKSITVPNSVTEIGSGAFSNCNELESLTVLADNVELESFLAGVKTFFVTSVATYDSLGSHHQALCALTYIFNKDSFAYPDDMRARLRDDIIRYPKLIIGNVIDDPVAVSCLTREELIHFENIDAYLDRVTNVEARAILLDYKHKRATPENIERAQQARRRRLEISMGIADATPDEIERIWRVKKTDASSCEVKQYMGDDKNVIVPSSIGEMRVTAIKSFAFEKAADFLENVIISSGIAEIEYGAFEFCRELKSATIPDSVTKIDSWAFDVGGGFTVRTTKGSVADRYARELKFNVEYIRRRK